MEQIISSIITKHHEDDDYGPTKQLHSSLMAAIWGPGVNFAIFIALYSYRKYWVWVHAGLFTIAAFFTIFSSLGILFYTGIITQSSKTYQKYSNYILNKHYLLGIACMGGIVLAMLLGVGVQAMNMLQARSSWLLFMKKVHILIGLAVTIICKADLYLIQKAEDLPLLIIQDVFFVIVFVVWKVKFPKMEGKQISPKYRGNIFKKIASVKELSTDHAYVIFANYVYQADPLKATHPAGYQIIKTLKNREVDRYIYGSTASEELPQIPIWSHSFRSFTLLGQPVAQIDIPQTFSGFNTPEVECKILQVRIFSQESNIYQLSLMKKQGLHFKWLKYQSVGQLGRYFSVTLNEKVTRLYTNVNFLVEENKQFLRKHLSWKQQGIKKNLHVYTSEENSSSNKSALNVHAPLKPDEVFEAQFYTNSSHQTYILPLMLKAYPSGQLTSYMTEKPIRKIVISCSKGEGLQLSTTNSGRIIIVAGGTGLFPFSDLFDLLYKEQLIGISSSIREQVFAISPVLKQDPFKRFKFQLLAAFNRLDDIHDITWKQLQFLNEMGRVKVTLRLKEPSKQGSQALKGIKLTTENFSDLLEREMEKEEKPVRVWICGLPAMNQSISKRLREKYQQQDLYLIV